MKLRHKLFFPFKDSRGYTLMEIIAVLAVIAIITSIAFTSLTVGDLRENTRAAAQGLRSDIRAAQEQSLTNAQAKVNGTLQPADYYGILLNGSMQGSSSSRTFVATSYSIIRIEHCGVLDCSTDSDLNGPCGANTTIVRTIKFPSGVTATTPNYGASDTQNFLRSITFAKETGKAAFYGVDGVSRATNAISTDVTITFQGQGNQSISVFQSSGRVE